MNSQSRWTPNQLLAIESNHQRILCAAGPGSGKSTTLVARITRLIAYGTKPSEIAAISFTNAASRNLQEKISEAEVRANGDGSAPAKKIAEPLGANSTLHAFALRCLKKYGTPFGYGQRTAMISPDSASDLMASKAETLNCKTPLEKLLKLKAEKGRPARGKRLTLEETVIATYLDELKEAGVVDYDVLLQEFRDMLTSDGPAGMSAQQMICVAFTHLFVDEVQDSAPIDWEIYRALPIENKFFVGDSDQSLYSFRGARVKEMIEESANPETLVIKLEENFRSRREICEIAQTLIEHNANRVAKVTTSAVGPGGGFVVLEPFANEGEEIGYVARKIGEEALASFDDVAVLTRTNDVAAGFRKGLTALGIPVKEQKKQNLPRDWPFARALMEHIITPENDSLAYFFLCAWGVAKNGKKPADARRWAQETRVMANATGQTINAAMLHQEPITKPESALAALVGSGVSRESYTLAAEKWRDLPPGATLEEFTVALAGVSDYTKEAGGEGVHVSTVHGFKGREADVVFLVGVEDESYPGQDAKEGEDGLEEARRCLYVGITRARRALYFTSVKTRATKWKAIVPRTPSRFLQEI